MQVGTSMRRNVGNQRMFARIAKRIFFKKDLQVHSCVHTGQGRFRCTNCPRHYNTRASMHSHHLVHQNKKYTCPKCPTFSTDTPTNLCQHQRGKHCLGWKAPCGKRYYWAPKIFCHKKKCSKCIAIKEHAEKAAKRLASKLKKNPSSSNEQIFKKFQLLFLIFS